VWRGFAGVHRDRPRLELDRCHASAGADAPHHSYCRRYRSSNNLHARVNLTGSEDEVKELADALDGMPRARHDERTGHGLGMAIIRAIVDAHRSGEPRRTSAARE
jgi:hypothetical protein